jgi:NAD(P)-dependent dehydrogenase (short-subunit alcohol dehydrogenase family)
VTGAGSSGPGIGTGKAISVLFAREGARVLLVDRIATPAEETLAAIREEGGAASVCEADVTNPSACQGLVETARVRYGRLDILVNNVGIRGPGSVVEVQEAD